MPPVPSCARLSRRRIHTHAYQYIVESLDPARVRDLQRYHEIPSIREKDEFLVPFIDTLTDPQLKTGTPQSDQDLLKSLIVFSCLMEGLFFYVGFAQILALGRQNKMTGAAEQYMYTCATSRCTANFGIDLVNTIKLENPHLWTAAFREELAGPVPQGGGARVPLRRGHHAARVLGLNAPMFKEYLRYIANRRLPADRPRRALIRARRIPSPG